MNNEEQILTTLQKILETQQQALAIHQQAVENQQQALNSQQIAVKNQLATGRIYRIAISILAVVLALLIYFLSSTWH